jgi:uncharacterized protein YecE (DUF72 family)
MIRRLHLGLPFWGFEGWQGELYTRDSRASDFLRQYGRAFNAVEGNTTFYAQPPARTVEKWNYESPDGFRFCFKLPRTITHDAMLRDVRAEADAFLERVEPLGAKLGPVMIQLPPNFGARELPRLEAFLEDLPRDFRYAVEFRDPELAKDGLPARIADDLLEEAGIGRVIMDTRPLRDGSGDHPDIRAARDKKPNLPVREEALSDDPIVRVVFHPDPSVNERWLERWSKIIAHWIGSGLQPLVFVHSPSNRESPRIARDLLARISALEPVGEMPAWPGEEGESASGQLALL